MSFLPLARSNNIEQMKREHFDVAVIGGGITGVGIARDAAMRGLRVALVERGDFASGTSSKSARMIHGGLRYLEHLQFGLVLSSCAERDILRRLAPGLVVPAAFTYPVYSNSKNGVLKIRAGMGLYDMLALFRNVKRHRILSPKEVARVEPWLRQEGLLSAAHYYDCLADDARLTLTNAFSAHRFGAAVINYAEVLGLVKHKGRVVGIDVSDIDSLDGFTVRSRIVVSATGVWTDRLRKMDDIAACDSVRSNRGTHVVVPRQKLDVRGAVAFTSIEGNRALYVVPWGHTCIIGTTDVDHRGDLDEVYATFSEVQNLLESTNNAFPLAKLETEDVISTYAGIRPLAGGQQKPAYQVSRDHKITLSDSGLLSITGGKLTTYRKMAAEVVNLVCKTLGKEGDLGAGQDFRSDRFPLTDESYLPDSGLLSLQEQYPCLEENVLLHLVSTYGKHLVEVLSYAVEDSNMFHRIMPSLPYIWAEVPYSVQCEMALTVPDFLTRRTHIIHEDVNQGLDCVKEIARVMGKYRDWDAAQIEHQIQSYYKEINLTREHLARDG